MEQENSSNSAIRCEGLKKSFGDQHALRGIDLTVARGECLAVFGPNGAGKTTLIKVLCTMSRPSGGSAWIDGLEIRKAPAEIRRKLGVVSHATFLYGNLTSAENLRFYGRMYDVPNLEDRIEEVLDQVHLRSRIHDRVDTLSRGMQQRVAIARSIIHNPSIMLMDEPETGLDPHATLMMRDVLDSINSGDRTVVVTTHDLRRGLELGDRIAILHKGRVVFEAPKAEIDAGRIHELYDEHTGAVVR